MCLVLLPYSIDQSSWNNQVNISNPDDMNGFTLYNGGNTMLVLNQSIQIVPGASFSAGGNLGEIYKGKIEIMFKDLGAPTPVNQAILTRKFYTGLAEMRLKGTVK